MNDNNLVSIAGNPTGELFLTDLRTRVPGVPIKIREAGDLRRIRFDLGEILGDRNYSDSLKLSGAENVDVFADYIRGGIEDVVDINHSHNCSVTIQKAESEGKYVSTIKGGSSNITLVINEQLNHGSEVDHDLGNKSQQSRAKTTGISITSRLTDGSAATSRVLNADRPKYFGGPWKIKEYPAIVIWFLKLIRVL